MYYCSTEGSLSCKNHVVGSKETHMYISTLGQFVSKLCHHWFIWWLVHQALTQTNDYLLAIGQFGQKSYIAKLSDILAQSEFVLMHIWDGALCPQWFRYWRFTGTVPIYFWTNAGKLILFNHISEFNTHTGTRARTHGRMHAHTHTHTHTYIYIYHCSYLWSIFIRITYMLIPLFVSLIHFHWCKLKSYNSDITNLFSGRANWIFVIILIKYLHEITNTWVIEYG